MKEAEPQEAPAGAKTGRKASVPETGSKKRKPKAAKPPREMTRMVMAAARSSRSILSQEENSAPMRPANGIRLAGLSVKKYSVSIRGHRTSYSLEPEFQAELQELADREGLPLARLITRIDANRKPQTNLSSALRLHVLKALRSPEQSADL